MMDFIKGFPYSRTCHNFALETCNSASTLAKMGLYTSACIAGASTLFQNTINEYSESVDYYPDLSGRITDILQDSILIFLVTGTISNIGKFYFRRKINKNNQPTFDLKHSNYRSEFESDFRPLWVLFNNHSYVLNIDLDSFGTERDWIDLVSIGRLLTQKIGFEETRSKFKRFDLSEYSQSEQKYILANIYALCFAENHFSYLELKLRQAKSTLSKLNAPNPNRVVRKRKTSKSKKAKNPGQILKKRIEKREKLENLVASLEVAVERWSEFFEYHSQEVREMLLGENSNVTPETRQEWNQLFEKGVMPSRSLERLIEALSNELERRREEKEMESVDCVDYDPYFEGFQGSEELSYNVQARIRREEFERRQEDKEVKKLLRYSTKNI